MTRAIRRYLTDKIARKRQSYFGGNQAPGWYRKWNGTCQCSMCQIKAHCGRQERWIKDERRNGPAE